MTLISQSNPILPLQSPLGPGSYNIQLSSLFNQNQCAPFNSTSLKKSIYDKTFVTQKSMTGEKIGPGTYQQDRVFQNKGLRMVQKNKELIIRFQGTKEFLSNVPRFKQSLQTCPGPGDYEKDVRNSTFTLDLKKKSLQKRKILKQKVQDFISDLKKNKKISNKPSIPNKTLTLQKRSPQKNVNQTKRHKSQQVSSQKLIAKFQLPPNLSKAFTWAKSQRMNPMFNHSIHKIGPGSYFKNRDYNQNGQKQMKQIIENNKLSKTKRAKTQSAYFKSKIARTFFDQFRKELPGPTDYNIASTPKNTHNNYQFFGSTVERFPMSFNQLQRQYYSQNPGKTQFSENSNFIGKRNSFNKRNHAFLTQQTKGLIKIQNDLPGPGDYDPVLLAQSFKPKKGRIIQNFGNSIQRFQPTSKINNSGQKITEYQYHTHKYQRDQPIKQSFMFKSKIKKICVQNDQTDRLFGTYDTAQFDLSTKIKKQRMFLQNLKKIQVQIPAFSSNTKRFNYQYDSRSLSVKQSIKTQPTNQNDQNNVFLTKKSQKSRQRALVQNHQQLTKNKKSTLYNPSEQLIHSLIKHQNIFIENNLDRFYNLNQKDKYFVPGVGEYSIRKNWIKKSYNVKYDQTIVNTQTVHTYHTNRHNQANSNNNNQSNNNKQSNSNNNNNQSNSNNNNNQSNSNNNNNQSNSNNNNNQSNSNNKNHQSNSNYNNNQNNN